MSSVICCLNYDARLVTHCGTSVDKKLLCYPEDSKFLFIVLRNARPGTPVYMDIKGLIDVPLKSEGRRYISLQCGLLYTNFWPWAFFIINGGKISKLRKFYGVAPLILDKAEAFGQINHTLNPVVSIGSDYHRITISDTTLRCGYQKTDKVISTRGFHVIYNVHCQKLCLGKRWQRKMKEWVKAKEILR